MLVVCPSNGLENLRAKARCREGEDERVPGRAGKQDFLDSQWPTSKCIYPLKVDSKKIYF